MNVLAQYFASRGWVAFSIDYRLRGDLGTVPEEWIQYAQDTLPDSIHATFYAIYPAHRDAKAALRWLFAHAATYKIDTEHITVGGGSAGAITSISLGISAPGDYRDEISLSVDPTLPTTHPEQSYAIHTILDFWGSDFGIESLREIYGYQRFDSQDPPMLIIHGTEDKTVLFENAEHLRSEYLNTGVAFGFYPLEGLGHGPWSATVDGKSLEELSFYFVVAQQQLTVE